ncbi:MAG: hypothetical protein OXE87_17405 [Chloroflexi bacterium]|nr:hypothetical protein [Chloroflexota bacterium]
MTGFTSFLLEQGIETELPIGLNDALGLLEEVVPSFTHHGRGYLLAAVSRGQLGSRWELAVKVTDPATNDPIDDQPVGFVHVARVSPDTTDLVIPPRTPEGGIDFGHFDSEGEFFGAFIFQMINALVDRHLMELPGVMPRFS